MYLAQQMCGMRQFYQIRQSFFDQGHGCHRHRLIFDLGERPSEHFDLYEDRIVLFHDDLQQAVNDSVNGDSDTVLEELLMEFFPWELRERLKHLSRTTYPSPTPLSGKDKKDIAEQIHIFDRKRLYFLYYGAIDQGKLYNMHEKLCRPLLNISRDEREYRLREMEKALRPPEYHNYIYAIFDLQRYFTSSFAAYLPEAMPEDEVADYFIERICALNTDPLFWQGEAMSDHLQPHLVRYLLMFFDFERQQRPFASEYVRQFINDHRSFRWPQRTASVSEEQVAATFGRSKEELAGIDRRELTRLYRQQALKLHPDQGGDHDTFVELTEAYSSLMRQKPKK